MRIILWNCIIVFVAQTPLFEDNLFIQQLSLGPTAAFKDMAMQMLGQEMNYELKKT